MLFDISLSASTNNNFTRIASIQMQGATDKWSHSVIPELYEAIVNLLTDVIIA